MVHAPSPNWGTLSGRLVKSLVSLLVWGIIYVGAVLVERHFRRVGSGGTVRVV